MRTFRCSHLLVLINAFFWFSIAASAATLCPNPAQPLPPGWTVSQGQLNPDDTVFHNVIIMGVMSNVSCVYTQPSTLLVLTKYGNFKPFNSQYWGPCPDFPSASCCADSQATCEFIATTAAAN